VSVLTAADLQAVRNSVSTSGVAVNYDKPTINAAAQAVEDWFEANRAALGNAVDAATAPKVLTAAQKKAIVAAWLLNKFSRGG
jgi:predicted trehalose synthase